MNIPARSLAQLAKGERAIIGHFELPEEMGHRLMLMGMIPGCEVEAAHVAPAGDPTVYRVDGTEIALRRETCLKILLEIENS
ncbi:FeoA family protein [Bryobacter aggregatus]|uniref:FeoA family protein n=1 Tax=Bryobacter aggregatus TaxID=360054 RepID=UPI0004E0F95E|nr:FeoA family protein [Bryobacter aggregatus]